MSSTRFAEDRANLALRVAQLAQADALSSASFLAPVIGRLPIVPAKLDYALATNGKVLAIDANLLLANFAASSAPPTHDVLHAVLHCALLHPFTPPAADVTRWWLACDIAVEYVAAQLLGLRDGKRGAASSELLHAAEAGSGDAANASRVMRWLMREDDASVQQWAQLLAADDHAFWTLSFDEEKAPESNQEAGDPAESSSALQEGIAHGASVGREVDAQDELRETWVRITRELKASLEALPREFGTRAGMLVQAMEAVLREKVDYATWLRRFATPGEVMRLSDDGIDLVFYTYGLQRYGNLPLVEPLEQREEHRIREFVIVIDTSQSVSGEAVSRFVNETYGILKEGETFFERVQVHIIQCDAQVQSDTVITDLSELERWAHQVELRGFGGTDFRPAFRYVDKLVEDGAFNHLGGLVYFTDGWGIYPQWRPKYPVAFAFYDDDHRAEDVPPWATQIVLGSGELGASA